MEVGFSGIGRQFRMAFRIEDMSGRDQVTLFLSLMEDLGIKEALWDNTTAVEAINGCIQKAWNK